MLSLRRPSADDLAAGAARTRVARLSASADLLDRVDAGDRPRWWFVDQVRSPLGHGPEVWARAQTAALDWVPLHHDWIDKYTPDGLVVGAPVATVLRFGGVWFTNWCRIVEVIDTATAFGFVYVTVAEHGERGAERFLVRRVGAVGKVGADGAVGAEAAQDDAVEWEITAVSRPQAWYIALGMPIVRRLQARFRKGTVDAMRRATVSVHRGDIGRAQGG